MENMKIRLRHDLGVCEGYLNARAGDVLEVSESSGFRYIKLGYAEAVEKGATVEVPLEKALAPEQNVETARVETPSAVADVPKPLDEEPVTEAATGAPVKPRATPATAARKR